MISLPSSSLAPNPNPQCCQMSEFRSGLRSPLGLNMRRFINSERSGSIKYRPLRLDCLNNHGNSRLMAIRNVNDSKAWHIQKPGIFQGSNRSSSANSKPVVDTSKNNSYLDFTSCPPMPFDLCPGANATPSSKKILFKEDREQCSSEMVLREGLVLLKGYLNLNEQASIVMECRRLGLEPGGFYWPKRQRMMMCLGQDWDPQTSKYSKRRQFDNCIAPDLPHEFVSVVRRSLIAAQEATQRKYVTTGNVEDIVPMISPDICLVQFYTAHGRLGYHQDRSESRGSLRKGLPIVSISLGDSSEFIYGDSNDIKTAKKVVLESGDVLIFGGPSRHIYHGVRSVIPRTAPKSLLDETGLRLGRLNLTFRQF